MRNLRHNPGKNEMPDFAVAHKFVSMTNRPVVVCFAPTGRFFIYFLKLLPIFRPNGAFASWFGSDASFILLLKEVAFDKVKRRWMTKQPNIATFGHLPSLNGPPSSKRDEEPHMMILVTFGQSGTRMSFPRKRESPTQPRKKQDACSRPDAQVR